MSDGVDDPREPHVESHIAPPESVPAVSAEELVDGVRSEPSGDADEERRYPSTIGGAFYLVVLAVCAVGVGIVATGEWRSGIRVFGAALLAAALARLLLPNRDAGMLAVRFKALDVVVLVALGTALILLAGSIPDQPGP